MYTKFTNINKSGLNKIIKLAFMWAFLAFSLYTNAQSSLQTTKKIKTDTLENEVIASYLSGNIDIQDPFTGEWTTRKANYKIFKKGGFISNVEVLAVKENNPPYRWSIKLIDPVEEKLSPRVKYDTSHIQNPLPPHNIVISVHKYSEINVNIRFLDDNGEKRAFTLKTEIDLIGSSEFGKKVFRAEE